VTLYYYNMPDKNILVRGHMRFAETETETDADGSVSDYDFFHRFSNKTYAQNIHSDKTPLAIAMNSEIIYKDMVELFTRFPPHELTAPSLHRNIDVYNHIKMELATALKELTLLGQVCGISLKDIMKESIVCS
jgi:hypothetical protein